MESDDFEKIANLQITIAQLLKMQADMNGNITRLNVNNGNDEPFISVIAIRGVTECREINQAIDEIEAEWESDRTP